ncbi:MAG: glutathione S-transferase family protein [Thermoleophilaceae bacterium]
MIKLYRAPYSTNVERVTLALAYKGLAVESVVIDYSDRSPVERVSGQGLVPVIDDGGAVVADSRRILHHLDERYPDPPLFPADPARRAEVDVFLDWFDGVWKVPPNAIEAELGEPEPDRERIGALSRTMAGWLDRFELLLTGRAHLTGDDFGAADCVAFPFLKYARSREPADGELFHRILDEHQRLSDAHPRLAGWIERVDARPRVC